MSREKCKMFRERPGVSETDDYKMFRCHDFNIEKRLPDHDVLFRVPGSERRFFSDCGNKEKAVRTRPTKSLLRCENDAPALLSSGEDAHRNCKSHKRSMTEKNPEERNRPDCTIRFSVKPVTRRSVLQDNDENTDNERCTALSTVSSGMVRPITPEA